jgi:hypothetical protein
MTVAASEWVDLIEREYLKRFIRDGGSAIKFVLGDDAVLAHVGDRLRTFAGSHNGRFVAIDAAATKLHMIQDVFFAVAREIDWEALAQHRVETMFRDLHYDWPTPGAATPLSAVAERNGVAETLVMLSVDQWLTRHIMRDRDMAQDFREAMAHLCRRRLESVDPRVQPPIVEWLRGELRSIATLRPLPISSRITRHNGRAMLRSLCHWLGLAGGGGLLVALDLRQIARSASGLDGLRYTPSAVLDAFEVLRQLVDDADSLEGMLLVVLAGDALLEGDARRTIEAYPALKARIVSDVQARGHDNPLSPLVKLAVDFPGVRGSEIVSAGEMPFSPGRVAIEALRAGVPNRQAVRLLGTSERDLCDRFIERLRRAARDPGAAGHAEGELVAGVFGAGKSHLLGYLAENALHQNFIVSQVAISKETPLFSPERLFAAAIRNAVVPDINDDVMTAVVERLATRPEEFERLEIWASSAASGLSPIFPALLHVLPRQVLNPDDRAAIARFLGGARLGTGRIRQWLRAAGAAKLFDIKAPKAADLALQRLRFAPALFRAAGFSGWCLLLDEVELIGRYSVLQRGKSYAELCRWLGLDRAVAVPGVIAVAAITEDFKSAVLDGRLDQEKVPRVLLAKGLEEQSRLAELGMRAIERRPNFLAAPEEEGLRQNLVNVRGLYEASYGWSPPVADIGERRAGKTMREYIKSWITDWDIQRLYGAHDVITTEAMASDYTEDKNLEVPPLERLEDED